MYEVGKKSARLMLWWKELDMWFVLRFSLNSSAKIRHIFVIGWPLIGCRGIVRGSQTFLGCDPIWTTISFRDPPACNAFFKRQGYISVKNMHNGVRKLLDNCSLFHNLVLIPMITERPISHMYEVGKKSARLMLWWKELDMWFVLRFSLNSSAKIRHIFVIGR
ncbi:hypothetical protein T08_6562 [Trichinella sp. T8]|nr:hypothetical protein T08_6562 [Trichinella sp. T8]